MPFQEVHPVKKTASRPKPRGAGAKAAGALNAAQKQAVQHGRGPLLIIAGAGTCKTLTLAHHVAHLIEDGVLPERILLLTFTRRAAAEMLHRVELLRRGKPVKKSRQKGKNTEAASPRKVWGGTFHAVGARLLRIHGPAIGVDPRFTIHDQADSADLLDALRTELKLAEKRKEFPKKGTCQTVHSGWINSGLKLEVFLKASYPWCLKYLDDLRKLFQAYAERKRQHNVFDFDDLLLYWSKLLADPSAGDAVRQRFDCVLVDEYQDTNPIQAEILKRLRPDGTGVTVVGDDAQSIYSFRGATIRNILDFPKQFPGTTVVKLEENYRSTEPILEVSNAVIAQAREGYNKRLRSSRTEGEQPHLLAAGDEQAEAREIVAQILRHRKEGVPLKNQAVLFRASHHSLAVEMELARKKIPFYKYGGLKFAEAAHVKDLVAFLRLAENPRDAVSGLRLLKLLPGIGPKKAQDIMTVLGAAGNLKGLSECKVPAAATASWKTFTTLLGELTREPAPDVVAQIQHVLKFYTPVLRQSYDEPEQRLEDLRKLRDLGERFEDRGSFLAELTLDPPASTQDLAGKAAQPADFLILSTIHSAKGLEWDAVFVINATEGAIPSNRAETPAQIDEERRLFYVALTRARNWLTVTYPLYRSSFQGRWGGWDEPPTPTRFLSGGVRRLFQVGTA
jgi:DNA helicase-2/ATP-dependent DNA helicase PcrA